MSKGLEMKYFVLSPKKRDLYGLASRMAMLAYAAIVAKEDPKLCADLRKWIEEIDLEIVMRIGEEPDE